MKAVTGGKVYDMESMREQLTGKCRHFTGLLHASEDRTVTCKAGISYYHLMKIDELGSRGCMCRTPCTGKKPGTEIRGHKVAYCPKYEAMTEQDIKEELDGWEQTKMALMNNVSSCCYAELDESQVIQEGPHAGHGPRFCSKCKKVAFMV